ncbi:2-C-methyl-D-erythritol 4-phosphate cytidylyltransferase [Gandjariella thermophila]|uniref:2-C-methyl-D-erythritol 4-phosphate cytidylyltransferase n=1 Tax=Gandjariella thermophila TaxID=1931992 RepID=UPI001CEFAC85|nr:2-C-methyl-D-erythritol 4-phosphate cytidylyltransferase [Gandjariella thermophila]
MAGTDRAAAGGRRNGPSAAAIVLASGSGTRVGADLNKVYLPLAGRRLVSWSVNTLAGVPEIGFVVLVIRPEDARHARWVLDREIDAEVEVVHGGATRQESELCALRHLAGRIDAGQIDTVLIHDAARPLVGDALVAAVLHAAREHGGAVPGVPRDDLVAVTPEGDQVTEVPRERLVAVQTPQGFRAAPLLAAYEAAAREGFVGTDTASCMERFSDVAVRVVAGDERNLKVTYPHDLLVAEKVLASSGGAAADREE